MKTLADILNSLNIDTDLDLYNALHNHLDTRADELDWNTLFNKLYEQASLMSICSHRKAMSYLNENDMSLRYSLMLAEQHGYQIKDLNSEILSTLLYQDELIQSIDGILVEIFDCIDELVS